MDEGTGTEVVFDQVPLEIKFHGTLSYAEKLMLKKYRRNQLHSSPVFIESTSNSSRLGSMVLDDDFEEEKPNIFSEIQVLDQQALGE